MRRFDERNLMKKIEHDHEVIGRLPDRNIANKFCPKALVQMRKDLAA
jgi:hypothetical protein